MKDPSLFQIARTKNTFPWTAARHVTSRHVTTRHVTSSCSRPGWGGIESKVGARVREESVSIIHREAVTSQRIRWNGIFLSLSLSRGDVARTDWPYACLNLQFNRQYGLLLYPPRRKETQTKFTGSVDLWETTWLSINKVKSSTLSSCVAAGPSQGHYNRNKDVSLEQELWVPVCTYLHWFWLLQSRFKANLSDPPVPL
jgi:hypothetical protein